MTTAIQCNFARCAIQHFVSRHYTKNHKLQYGAISQVMREYNDHFASESNLQVKYTLASKHFVAVAKRFNDKWHPQEIRGVFLAKFNIEVWQSLSQEEKGRHTLSCCKACQQYHPDLTSVFPRSVKRGRKKTVRPYRGSHTISLSKQDLSSPAALGGRVLKELTTISQQVFNKTGQEVLTETPRSSLKKSLSAKESKKQRKEIEKEIKNAIVTDKSEIASRIVTYPSKIE